MQFSFRQQIHQLFGGCFRSHTHKGKPFRLAISTIFKKFYLQNIIYPQ